MAHGATKHFVLQRFTALIQVPLVIWLVISVLRHAGDTHAEFMQWIGRPLTAGLMILFLISVAYHMRIGMGEVIADYIHKRSTNSALGMLNTVIALVLSVAAVFSVIAITLIV
jgi:succinate dehydrogenase / fumarate reductase membrane anchor subunit